MSELDALRARVARLEEERRYLVAAGISYGIGSRFMGEWPSAFPEYASGLDDTPGGKEWLSEADACLAALDAEAGQ